MADSTQKRALLRLQMDVKQARESSDTDCGVSAGPVSDANIFVWEAQMWGPVGTVYEGGVFTLDLQFPKDYPLAPVKVKFRHPQWHPNIYRNGDICLDTLTSKWTAANRPQAVLIAIRSLLDDPNPDSPANHEAATGWRKHMEPKKNPSDTCGCGAECTYRKRVLKDMVASDSYFPAPPPAADSSTPMEISRSSTESSSSHSRSVSAARSTSENTNAPTTTTTLTSAAPPVETPPTDSLGRAVTAGPPEAAGVLRPTEDDDATHSRRTMRPPRTEVLDPATVSSASEGSASRRGQRRSRQQYDQGSS